MKALLLRTGSITAQSPVIPAPKGAALSRQDSHHSGVFYGDRAYAGSPRISMRSKVNRRTGGIRRALSETDLIRSTSRLAGARSMSFPSMVPEEVHVDSGDEAAAGYLTPERNFDEMWTRGGILVEEVELGGDGFGKGSESGGDGGDHGSGGGFGGSRKRMGEHYREMLKSNPGDPLLLGNYGKYLHEVERDFTRAEEYYGRAVLANPGDGEVLSLYGKLIWETKGDGQRARSYFDRAVQASPDDCTVLGSYANFMWEAEEEGEEEEEDDRVDASMASLSMAL